LHRVSLRVGEMDAVVAQLEAHLGALEVSGRLFESEVTGQLERVMVEARLGVLDQFE
jgi:hypothetical protein